MLGQWLGRVTASADAVDWLVVVGTVSPRGATPAGPLVWVPFRSLVSSAALLDYQQWATTLALEGKDLPSVPGPFGAATWLQDVKAWICRAVGAFEGSALVPYRTTAYEVVIGIPTPGGRVYFKGLSPDRAKEQAITVALASVAPDSFAQTVAIKDQRDGTVWWLTAECKGAPLMDDETGCGALRVAAEIGRLQRRHASCMGGRRHADAREVVPTIDLEEAAAWAVHLLRNSARALGSDRCCAAIERAFDEVSGADVPHGWIALDPHPGNILGYGDTVRFIDLDETYRGPAPLAIAALKRNLKRAVPFLASQLMDEEIHRAYEGAWFGYAAEPLVPNWPAFDVVAAALEAHLGWSRALKREARGEVHGVVNLARERLARRLERAVGSTRRNAD